MPHVILKMYAGRSDEQKSAIAEALTDAVMRSAGASREAVSVAIEDVAPDDWMVKVYGPDILDKSETVFAKPGYGSFR